MAGRRQASKREQLRDGMLIPGREVPNIGVRSVHPKRKTIDAASALQFNEIESNQNVLVALDDAGGLDAESVFIRLECLGDFRSRCAEIDINIRGRSPLDFF